MQARYYDPVIGRFYSNDPVGFTNIHTFNRYAYANNNPYKYVDPDGRVVVVASRSLDLKEYTKGVGNIGIIGSHTMTIVSTGDGNPTIYSSLNIDGKNVFRKNHTADVNALGAGEITDSVVIKPPEGMTSEEFDKAVISAGEFMETRESLNYSAFPSGQSEGNCHTCTRNLIDAAGEINKTPMITAVRTTTLLVQLSLLSC